MLSCSVTRRSEQEFGIAVAAVDRRGDYPEHAPAERDDELRDIVADGGMNSGIAHDAFFDGARAGLELRLDQRDELRGSFGERYTGGSTNLSEMKLTSMVTKSGGSSSRAGERVRISVASSETTSGRVRNVSCNCP